MDSFIANDKFPKNDVILKAIESEHPAFSEGTLTRLVSKDAWRAMCSFAHGGAHQITRRFNGQYLGASYPDGEQMEVVRSADFFMLLSALEMITLTDRPQHVDDLLAELRLTVDQMRGASHL